MADGLTAERWTSTPVSGLVRRDLKLENILLTAGGDVKLSDFGLGAVREAAAESHLLHTVRRFSHRSPETLSAVHPQLHGGPADPVPPFCRCVARPTTLRRRCCSGRRTRAPPQTSGP